VIGLTSRKEESGCDDRLPREQGWSPRGVPCFDTRLGHAGERLPVIAAWMPMPMPTHGLMAPLSFDGTCHRRWFELWLRGMLCPLLPVSSLARRAGGDSG